MSEDSREIFFIMVKTKKGTHTKCKVEGCLGVGNKKNKDNSSSFILGYCNKHYQRLRKFGDVNFVSHIKGENRGLSNTYRIYNGMKNRCLNKNDDNYKKYGAKGITICDRWLGINGYSNFLADMGERPKGYSLDRINNDLRENAYSKDNCRWATIHEQAANKINSGKCAGVSFDKRIKRWNASIWVNGERYYIGVYINYEDAVTARKTAEIKFGIISRTKTIPNR